MIHNAITEEVKNMKKWKAPVIIALTAEDLAKHINKRLENRLLFGHLA